MKNNRNIIISDCHLYENRGAGIYYDDVNLHQSNITGCTILDSDNTGLWLKNLKYSRVSDCLIRDDRPDAQSVSLKVEGGRGNLIQGNLLGTTPQIEPGSGQAKGNLHP